MKMKKHVLFVVLALIFYLMLAGCGKAMQNMPAPTATPAVTEAPAAEAKAETPDKETTPAPAEAESEPAELAPKPDVEPEPETELEADGSSFVGTWKPYSQEGSISITHEQLVEMGYADQMALTFKPDGTLSVYMFGMTQEETWTDNGDGSGTATISGEIYPMTIHNGMLAMDMGSYVAYYENGERPAGGAPVPQPEAPEVDSIPLPSKANAPALPYTLPNGLTIDELSVVLAGGRMWSFGYALQNPTGSAQSFDPSKFVLRDSEGNAIKTYASFVSADEVKPDVPLRTSVNIGTADALNLGDEVYFFYNGVFLGTSVARDF